MPVSVTRLTVLDRFVNHSDYGTFVFLSPVLLFCRYRETKAVLLQVILRLLNESIQEHFTMECHFM